MELPQALRVARKRAGLSQEALARKADISIGSIRGFEQGTRVDPQYSSLSKIATALGMTVSDLVNIEEDPGETWKQIKEEYAEILNHVHLTLERVREEHPDVTAAELQELANDEYVELLAGVPEDQIKDFVGDFSKALSYLSQRPELSSELVKLVELRHALKVVSERVSN